DTGSNPKANPSKTTNSSTPTNAPTTSPKPSEPTTANPTSHQCATVLLWPAESAHTSPKESLNRPSLTAARANPAQAEQHYPRWADQSGNKQQTAGKTRDKNNTKK